jgi:hypothetical protein
MIGAGRITPTARADTGRRRKMSAQKSLYEPFEGRVCERMWFARDSLVGQRL